MGALLLLIVGQPLAAADSDAIEITAPAAQTTRVPFKIGDTADGEFTGFREVIEKEELQQAGGSLAEVIASETGVQFRQSGGLGSFSTISLRGSTAEQVNVYVDGVLLNEAAGGGVNLSHIELMQAERVEVYRGTIPVQLGNSAIGGAVNITTARASESAVTTMLAGFGSFGSSRFSTAFTGPVNWLNGQSLVASFSHRQSDNNFSFLNDNGTSFNTEDDEVQRRLNGQTQSTSGFVKSGHEIAGVGRLEHAIQLGRHSQGISNWSNTSNNGALVDTDQMQWRSSLTRKAGPGEWSSLWGAHYGSKKEIYDASEINNNNGRLRSNTNVLGGRGYWEKLLDNQSLSVNVRGRSEWLESYIEGIANDATNAQRLRSDLNVQWNRYFNSGDSLFSASMVGFVLSDEYQIENNQNLREDFSERRLMPQLGLHHPLGVAANGLWSVTANASRQKRVPSFFELFGSRGLFNGNPDLDTETSDNLDVGIKWLSDTKLPVDAAVEVALFHSHKENLISRIYNARGIGRSENISRGRSRGLEVIGRMEMNNGYWLDANFTLQDTENLSDISGFTGKQLPGEASIDGSITAGWKNNVWKAEYEYQFNSERFYDSANLLVAADQRVHSLRLSRYWHNWRLALEVNNLTDQNYEDFNGYPTPGRAGFISIFYQP